MQKVFNVMTVASFAMSGSLVGLSIAAFARIPGMIDDMAADMMDDITGTVTEMVPGQVEELMPEMPKLPTETGPAIPFK
jgi:Na+/H+-translocating membrane pyrophosphatase